MANDALKSGKKITLTRSDNGERYVYTIVKQLGIMDTGRIGAFKAVYIAEKRSVDHPGDDGSQLVVLKEFFPKTGKRGIAVQDVQRNSDGSVTLSDSEVLTNARETFKKEAGKLKEYKGYPEMEDQICAPEDVCILEGNGTLYFENEFHEGAASWQDLKGKNKLKADEILLTALQCFRFLKKMHIRKDAMVDFKPSDVLLGYDQLHGEFKLNCPMFYDFGSSLPIDHEYPKADIWCTDSYAPGSFESGKSVCVDKGTEQFTFLSVCMDMLKGCKEKYTKGVQTKIMNNLNPYKPSNTERSEDETEDLLNDLHKEVQKEEFKFNKGKLPMKKMIFTLVQIVALIIVLGIYLFMGFLLAYLCINADAVRVFIEGHGISEILIAVVLAAGSFVAFGLRLLVDWMSERIARLQTSVAYFYRKDRSGKEMRNGDFNSFRYGWRRSTTFQDKSELNRKRQHLRWILWACLFLAIVTGLVLSMVFNAFPLFFAIGCAAIIVFMYADYLPSAKEFFYSCCPKPKKKYPSTRLQEAYFFKQEFEDSQVNGKYGPFDLNSEYYEKDCRNLLKIKQTVKDKLDADPGFDLGFNPFQMRHIYKMSFDRLRNVQLIINLSVLVVMLTTVFIDFMGFTGKLETFFRIPREAYIYVTLVLVILVTLVSIAQTLISRGYEELVADVSYKSRYVVSESLNELLTDDIAKGVVKNIDIARGINQAEAALNTMKNVKLLEEGTSKKELEKNSSYKNRRMVHHEVLSNRRRLTIAVWLSFVTLSSVLVWLCRIYWLFPVLLIGAAVINISGNMYFIELIERKRIIRSIRDLEEYDKENEAK